MLNTREIIKFFGILWDIAPKIAKYVMYSESEIKDACNLAIKAIEAYSVPEGDNDDISHIFDNVPQEEIEKIAKALVGWDTEKIRKEIQGGKE